MLTLTDSSNRVKSFFVFVFFLFVCVCACACVLVAQSCPALCYPTDCSPPGFSVHGILQARILECIAIPFSRGTSQPRDRTLGSCIAGRFFTIWAPGKFFFVYGFSLIVVAHSVKNLPAMQENWVQSLGWEDTLEKGVYLFQYSCLENSVDRGAWQATVHGVAKS